MMKFPQWVTGPASDPVCEEELASNRLRFLLMQAATHAGPKGSIIELAAHVGVTRQNLYMYISRGSFPVGTAKAIERAVGREFVRKEHLVFPLEIEATE